MRKFSKGQESPFNRSLIENYCTLLCSKPKENEKSINWKEKIAV
jgi:hypothetical protein